MTRRKTEKHSATLAERQCSSRTNKMDCRASKCMTSCRWPRNDTQPLCPTPPNRERARHDNEYTTLAQMGRKNRKPPSVHLYHHTSRARLLRSSVQLGVLNKTNADRRTGQPHNKHPLHHFSFGTDCGHPKVGEGDKSFFFSLYLFLVVGKKHTPLGRQTARLKIASRFLSWKRIGDEGGNALH